MDETDRKILRAVQNHPDLGIKALAERIGLSHTPCWRRLKKLEDEGVILGRPLVLDQDRIGPPITAFAQLKLKRHDELTLEALD